MYTVKKENKKNMVSKKYITTGLSYNDNTLITKGLDPNDLVIVKGYHLVSSGVEVNLIK